MRSYLLAAAAVIFLSVIVSLVIPDGKLNKTIVFVMRMACILVLLQPITGLFKITDVSADQPLYDYAYISKVYSENQSGELDKLLAEKFDEQLDCSVEVIYEKGNFKIGNVTVEVDTENIATIEEIHAYLEELGYINITVYAKSY